MNAIAWLIFLAAALLEIAGDAMIRRGLRGQTPAWIITGGAMLTAYGLIVNSVRWDFSRALGVYVGFFALISVLCGRFVFRETIPPATWLGLALVMTGCLVIQFGGR